LPVNLPTGIFIQKIKDISTISINKKSLNAFRCQAFLDREVCAKTTTP
jgi:hypothetical protein